jgi:Protein of unknown function (DUF3237)
MKRCILASFVASALATAAQAAEGPNTSIDTEYLGTLKVTTEPPQAAGMRAIYNVTSCTLEGPKIRAACISPSADWTVRMQDGSRRLDIRATLKTEEGEFIFVEGDGIIYGGAGYGMAALRFTTNSKSYEWLNSVQTVAKRIDGVFDVFVVR